MDHAERLSRLVFEASNLRDYLMHVEGLDGEVLGRALRPFDRADDYQTASDEEISELRKAFQSSYDDASLRIDSYTLGVVLKGKSPQKLPTPILTSLVLSIIGLALVLTAFNFTYWSNRATTAVAAAERFIAFEHSPQLNRLIEMKHYFEQVSEQAKTPDLEPQLIYLEGISELQSHYLEERTLPVELNALVQDARSFQQPWAAVNRRVCGWSKGEGAASSAVRGVFGCPDPNARLVQTNKGLSRQLTAPQTEAKLQGDDTTITAFTAGFKKVNELQLITMEEANRHANNLYQDSRHAVRLRMQELREGLNAVHLWALPIIYGALGSIVYCMWRVLNPNIAPLGFFYSITRTIFAGLAALTLSMLLVPSNILTAGVELNRPLIYLLSFVFGYSVEVFINTLNLLNSYFLSNLGTRPKSIEK